MKNVHKKVAIYNRWLFTLGGGEQVTFAYAEALRDLGYQTTLLTHREVDIKDAEKKMNVNLHGIRIQYQPIISFQELTSLSEEYDLFINTSYLDYFPNASKNGILSVFFPGEIYLSPWEYFKRLIVLPASKNFFIYPTQFENFEGDTYEDGKICKWIGKNSVIHFSNSSIKGFSIELFFPTFKFSDAEELKFEVNNHEIKPIDHRYKNESNSVIFTFKSTNSISKFSIKKSSVIKEKIALVRLTIPRIRYLLYNHFKNLFPRWEMRLHGGPSVTPISDLRSYQKIITISKFCQLWIKQYWNLSSEILYPPVNTGAFHPSVNKKNWITHIGRFFVTGHSKKQLELIRVFKNLIDSKSLESDWELHFIGSVHEGKVHQEYFESCLQEAQNYPIHFHISIPFDDLKRILAQSKIYWHATGLDDDPNKQPILMEHFGITTVEAMASGCVPVVIDAGGQPEIIQPGTGFVWKNREELKNFTIQLSRDEILRKEMMQKAIIRSKDFSIEQFKKKFKKLIEASI